MGSLIKSKKFSVRASVFLLFPCDMNRTDDGRADVVLTVDGVAKERDGEFDGITQPNTWEGQPHSNNTPERRFPDFMLRFVDSLVGKKKRLAGL